MLRAHGARWLGAAALCAIVALGVLLRLTPELRQADDALLSDGAFHIRMTRTVVARGSLPRIDSLAMAPRGRSVAALLPTGLYAAAAGFHRLVSDTESRLEQDASLFIALAGGFIAFPVFGAAWALYRRRDVALLAALVAVVLPAHLHRTFGYWFRYEP